MPRTVEFVTRPEETDGLIAEIRNIPGLLSLSVQRGISIQPPGDVIHLAVTIQGLHELMRRVERPGEHRQLAASVTTSQPLSLVSSTLHQAVVQEPNEATWEEMGQTIARESNVTANTLILVAVAAVAATVGIATNALHLVLAAVTLVPGFLPITRISLGIVTHSSTWRRGVIATLEVYATMVAGAAIMTLLLRAMGQAPLGGEASYLPQGVLINYWTSITIPSLLVSGLAGLAGAVLLASNRPVLTLGVMIALALVPGATLAGMGLATGDLALAGRGALRWAIDAGLVIVASLLVFAWKRATVQRRRMAFES